MKQSEFIEREEKKQHGDFMFPFVTYGTFIPRGITSFPIHWHEEVELVVAYRGVADYYLNGEKVVLNEGDILFISPSTLHSFNQKDDSIFMAEAVLFNLNLINNSIDICNNKYFSPLLSCESTPYFVINKTHDCYEELIEIVSKLLFIYKEKTEYFELEIKSLLLEMFYILFSNNYFTINNNMPNNASNKIIKSVLNYIQENYNKPLTLNDISNRFKISIYHLSHMFKDTTRMSCIDYIIDFRLLKASQLLLTTDEAILNIALEVGFNNISYFNRAFKKKFNTTPSAYRKGSGNH